MPIPRNPETEPHPRQKKNRQHSRVRFAQQLNRNIAKYSQCVMRPGGNVTVAVVNYDFCYELIEIYMETLTQFLLKNEEAFFDQFGRFEIRKQKARTINSPITNGILNLPEIKMIKFVPSKRLKDRIKGLVKGRIRRRFARTSSEVIYADEEIDDENNEIIDDQNILECEEN